VKVGTGVGVRVEVGDGMKVDVGISVDVGVEVAGANPGREHAWMESTSTNMVKSSFFMERNIHGRERGVKERTAVSIYQESHPIREREIHSIQVSN
jgi:hypothetical protein